MSVANRSTTQFDSDQLIDLFIRIQYISYLITIIILSVIFQLLYLYLINNAVSSPRPSVNYLISDSSQNPQESAFQGQLPTPRDTILSLSSLPPNATWYQKLHAILISNSKVLIPTCYALVSAMIGSQSVVLSKSCSFLITESIDSNQQFNEPETYAFIISWCMSMMFWLYRMNAALRKFEGVFIIPILQVLWMLFSILSGGILFREFDGYHWYNYLGFVIGTMIIFYGVHKLSPKKNEGKQQEKPELLASINDTIKDNKESLPSSSSNINPNNVSLQIDEEAIDPKRVKERIGSLCDDAQSMNSLTTTSNYQPSINSLRNSQPDPRISEPENIRRDDSLTIPSNSLSLRTIHKFFASSQKLLSIELDTSL